MTERIFDFEAGEVLAIDKPYEWTSFDVVNRVRAMLKRKLQKRLKVGHAGTLDPLATGLLIVCTGKMTKQIDTFQAQQKEYTGTFCIGATTPCFDLERPIDKHYPVDHITEQMIHDTAKLFVGEQLQVPPQFSAIKVEGERAYELARAGHGTPLEPRKVIIPSFEILQVVYKENMIDVNFRVSCSKGTYIRALARDFGLKLGSGAYLGALRRTRSGDFRVDEAFSLEQIKAIVEALPGGEHHQKP